MQKNNDDYKKFTRRAFVLGSIKLSIFPILVGRLYYLQILNNRKYDKLSDNNRIQIRYLKPKRGKICDSKGVPIAYEKPSYQCVIYPKIINKNKSILEKVEKILSMSNEEKEKLHSQLDSLYLPKEIIIKDKISFDEVIKIESISANNEGVRVEKGFRRNYDFSKSFCHCVGYVGISSDSSDISSKLVKNFKVGKSGVERVRDEKLRGNFGIREVEVNAKGQNIKVISEQKSLNGDDIKLNINHNLQEYIYERLKDYISATAIVMDSKNGNIHSMVSFPGFDSNIMTHGLSHKQWNDIITDPGKPLHNKAISGLYPPGSVIKMIVMISALKQGIINHNTRFHCSGHLDVGSQRFHCWNRYGHGTVSIKRAIIESCDVYFYEIAKRINMSKLASDFKIFGFGSLSGIDLMGESKGVVPDKTWKEMVMGKSWNMGETINTCIGQGYFLVTPIQICNMMVGLLNPKKFFSPTIVKDSNNFYEKHIDNINHKDIEYMKPLMDKVFDKNYKRNVMDMPIDFSMGGKTGTAQVRRIKKKDRKNNAHKLWKWKSRDHSIFTGYSPVKNPRFVATVIVEHGGWGSKVAAPLGRDILIKAHEIIGDKS